MSDGGSGQPEVDYTFYLDPNEAYILCHMSNLVVTIVFLV